jgi:hypothetical protein
MVQNYFAMFVLIFAGTSYLFVEDYGWPLAFLIFALNTTVLILAFNNND